MGCASCEPEMPEAYTATVLAKWLGSAASPRSAVRYPRKMGVAVGAQVGTMRTPLRGDTAWLASRTVTICPGSRLLPSRCCTLIQPSCQACGVLKQRCAQQEPMAQLWSAYLQRHSW